MKNETSVLLADLNARIAQIVEVARKEGHDHALNEIRSLVGGGLPVKRGPGRPPKSASALVSAAPAKKTKRKNPWKDMTPEQKADRVRKMLAGRGLKPKSEQ
jgi:hypothetical protein